MRIVVARQELAAALMFASDDEDRFVLTGVNIEVEQGSKPTIAATDGRRLAVIESGAMQHEEFEQKFSILIQPSYIKAFCSLSKACGGKLFPWLCLETVPLSKRLKISLVGSTEVTLDIEDGAIIQGQYPDWRKCVPPKNSRREAVMKDLGLNAEFIGDFAKAAKILGSETPIVQMNLVGKDQAIEVKLSGVPNFYGLVMQCKADESMEYQPEFLKIVQGLPEKSKPKEDPSADKETSK